ncbi:MAG: hypothetical protein ABIN48_09255 [Ginsengibacter sp.]
MITQNEKEFMAWWEKNRDKEKKFAHHLIYGSPWGLIFALPVLVAVIFNDWYKNMIAISKTQIIIISLVVLGIALFYAIFKMQVKWEQNDQHYKELKLKENKNDAALL